MFRQRQSAVHVAGLAAIALLTLVAYIPALQSGFIWDDDKYLTENSTLTADHALRQIWLDPSASPQYYPLVFTTFWLEMQLWGLEPAGFHAVNVLLHIANACLLWLVLQRLAIPGSWWVAAVFALHPVHVESVAWVTERKNVLSGLFYLIALICYLASRRRSDASSAAVGRGWLLYGLGLASFVAALLSKTVTASLPAAILLVLWWKRQLARRDILLLLPWFVVGTWLGLNTVALERHQVGVEHVDLGIAGIDRVLVAGRVVWFYLGKLLWPDPLIFIYPRFVVDRTAAWQYLFPLAALSTLAALWCFRKTWGRAPLSAALLFGGTLFPALGFIDVYPMIFSWVADHFQYLASIAPLTLVVAGLARFGSTTAAKATQRWMAGTAGLVLLGLAALTWQQCQAYHSRETLWRETLRLNPNATLAHNNLGVILREQGKIDEAIAHHEAVFTVVPPERNTFALARAYFNLGNEYFLKGWYDRSLAAYQSALSTEPRYHKSHHGLGVVLLQLGRVEQAVAALETALSYEPNNAQVREHLALAHRRLRREAR